MVSDDKDQALTGRLLLQPRSAVRVVYSMVVEVMEMIRL